MRWLMHKLFGVVFVILEDFDGELNMRRVQFMGPCRMATRMTFASKVQLLPGGRVKGACYVEKWHRALGDPGIDDASSAKETSNG